MKEQGPSGVGRTAVGMAWVRACETQRADRLFEDPYAAAFVAEAPQAIPAWSTFEEAPGASVGAAFAAAGAVRTRFYDDFLLEAASEGCRQVVLVAAGLDTRAFRLLWPTDTHVFEMDLSEVLDFKQQVLTRQAAVPRCQRTFVSVDLRRDWPSALRAAGFDPATPTAWLVEGLLVYLASDEAVRLLTAISDLSAPGSRLSTEGHARSNDGVLGHARRLPTARWSAELWKAGLDEDLAGWLTQHGWQARGHDRAAMSTAYGRPVPDDGDGPYFVTARRNG